MAQASHRLVHQMHLVYHPDGRHHISVRQAHQAMQLCHRMDTIHQAHHRHTLRRVQTTHHLVPYQIIRQIARTTHQPRPLMVNHRHLFTVNPPFKLVYLNSEKRKEKREKKQIELDL